MLYNIIPPTVFLVSLAGVVVILSRGVSRLRGQELAASLEAAATTTSPPHDKLLKPTTKGVHLITDRLKDLRGLGASLGASIAAGFKKIGPLFAAGFGKLSVLRSMRLPRRRKKQQMSAPAPAPVATKAPKVEAKKKVVSSTIEKPAPKATPVITKTVVALQKKKRSVYARESLTEKATTELEAGNLDKAEDMLLNHIVKKPRDEQAYLLLAEVACRRGGWEEALEIYEQLIAWQASAPGIHACLGKAALHAGKLTYALEELQQAHEEEPANKEVLQGLLKIAQVFDNQVLISSAQEKLAALDQKQPAS